MADDPRPMLAPRAVDSSGTPIPLLAATLPFEAFDPTHPDHDDFVRTVGRCFAADCPTHNPTGPQEASDGQ